jgi:hypothetical protein
MLIDILKDLPPEMPLGEALIEAVKLKRDDTLLKDRERSEKFRQAHKEYKALKSREYYIRKKAKSGSEKSQEPEIKS